jgi:hypothetical protein
MASIFRVEAEHVSRVKGIGKQNLSCYLSRWFLTWLILEPWRWKEYVPPKFLLAFNGLHRRQYFPEQKMSKQSGERNICAWKGLGLKWGRFAYSFLICFCCPVTGRAIKSKMARCVEETSYNLSVTKTKPFVSLVSLYCCCISSTGGQLLSS